MKKVTRTTKLLSWFVMITFCFLCVFNVTYSYFTVVKQIKGSANMNSVNVSFVYISQMQSVAVPTNSTMQLVLNSDNVSRGEAYALNIVSAEANGLSEVSDIGFSIASDSCDVYIRFWVEAYKMIDIKGASYYIDSNGNYVDENGNYVDGEGVAIEVEEANRGDVVDYGQYFELGYLNNAGYNIANSVYKNTTTYKNNNYVTYFYKDLFEASDGLVYLFNAIKWLDTAPNDLLGSAMGIFVSFEAVQSGEAYLSAFDDYRGYYNW